MLQNLLIASVALSSYQPLTPSFDDYLKRQGFPLQSASYRIGPKARYISKGRFEYRSANSSLAEWTIGVETVNQAAPDRKLFIPTNMTFVSSDISIPGATVVEEPRAQQKNTVLRVITDYSQITMSRRPLSSVGSRGLKQSPESTPAQLRSELITAMKKFVAEYRPVINAIMKEGGVRSSKYIAGK